MKTKGTTKSPGRTGNAGAAMAAFEAGSGSKRKMALGGRRKSLIRLDSAKEIEGLYFDFVALDLDFVAPGLDFVAKNLDFRSEFGNPPSRRPMVNAFGL